MSPLIVTGTYRNAWEGFLGMGRRYILLNRVLSGRPKTLHTFYSPVCCQVETDENESHRQKDTDSIRPGQAL